QLNNSWWISPWKDLTSHKSSGLQRLSGAVALMSNLVPEGRGAKVIWKGREISLGSRLRIAPFGGGRYGRQGHRSSWAVRLPHWHWRGMPDPGGLRRTSKDWHRPWQTLFRRWFR